jgi:hypothetical protein
VNDEHTVAPWSTVAAAAGGSAAVPPKRSVNRYNLERSMLSSRRAWMGQ